MTHRPLTPQERGAVLELLVCDAEYVWNDMPRLFARDVVEPWMLANGWWDADAWRDYGTPTPGLHVYHRDAATLTIDWRPSATDDALALHVVTNVLPGIHGLAWEEIMLAMIAAAPCEARACLVDNRTLVTP